MRAEEIRDEAKNLVNEITTAAQRSLDRMADYAQAADRNMRAGARTLVDREREAVGYARGVVGTHPLSSIALAVLVGVVLGWLIRR